MEATAHASILVVVPERALLLYLRTVPMLFVITIESRERGSNVLRAISRLVWPTAICTK